MPWRQTRCPPSLRGSFRLRRRRRGDQGVGSLRLSREEHCCCQGRSIEKGPPLRTEKKEESLRESSVTKRVGGVEHESSGHKRVVR